MAGQGKVEFHVEDLERVAEFYDSVFGWDILEEEDEDEGKGKKSSGKPAVKIPDDKKFKPLNNIAIEGVKLPDVLFTAEVPSMPEALSLIALWEGEIVLTDVAGPKKGTLAYCKDTEGNLFSILQPHSR